MPRGKSKPHLSNLSLIIPRRIHRRARVKFIQSMAPSFAAWVGLVLDEAPDQLTHIQMFKVAMIETELKAAARKESAP